MTTWPFWMIDKPQSRKVPIMPIDEEIRLFNEMRFWKTAAIIQGALLVGTVLAVLASIINW